MDGPARTRNSSDDRSMEDMLALIEQGGMSSVGAPLPSVSDLGQKGELKFYLKDLGKGQALFKSCRPGELLPLGTKEITWEQACEVLIRLKVKSENDQKLRELVEQKWELVSQYQELIRKQRQLAKEVGGWTLPMKGNDIHPLLQCDQLTPPRQIPRSAEKPTSFGGGSVFDRH